MIEPELPSRLFRRGSTRTEIVIDLVINVDGSVRSAAVRSSSNGDIEAVVLEAVRQWRYEPQAVVRSHLVRLVVSPS
jgi:TonB family protein